MNRILGLLFVGLVMGGCVDAELDLSEHTAAAIGPATITTDASTYQFGDYITVNFSGLNGNATDWISIAPAGSPLTTVSKWKYTGGTASGSVLLGWPTPGGSYVARAFDNNTYTLMGESDPFTVGGLPTGATVAFDQADYAIDQDIVVSFSGLAPTAKDWVAIKPVGAPETTEARWYYTGGTASGTVSFPRGLAVVSGTHTGGNYIARLYVNDTYSSVAETGPILIGSLITTDASTYPTYSPITVNWTHLPGNATDWIALAPQGSMLTTVTKWVYTGGGVNGSRVFNPGLVSAGTYVARAFAPNTYFRSGESAPFTVTGATITVTTDMAMYATGQAITVSWSGLPGNATDWVSLAPQGSSDTTVTKWVYTGGAASGMYTFTSGLSAPGNYVARAYINNSYTKVGESTTIGVQ